MATWQYALIGWIAGMPIFYFWKTRAPNPFAKVVWSVAYWPVLALFSVLASQGSRGKRMGSTGHTHEAVLIQWQTNAGTWQSLSRQSSGTDIDIKVALDSAQRFIGNGGTGRVRAIGEKSGRLYDIR